MIRILTIKTCKLVIEISGRLQDIFIIHFRHCAFTHLRPIVGLVHKWNEHERHASTRTSGRSTSPAPPRPVLPSPLVVPLYREFLQVSVIIPRSPPRVAPCNGMPRAWSCIGIFQYWSREQLLLCVMECVTAIISVRLTAKLGPQAVPLAKDAILTWHSSLLPAARLFFPDFPRQMTLSQDKW